MGYRRIISAVLVPTTVLLFTGCPKTVWVSPTQLQPEQRIKEVVTSDGRVYELDPWVAGLRGDTIYADAGEDAFRLGLGEVERVGVQRTDWLKTLLVIVIPSALFVGACAMGMGSVGYNASK